MRAATREKEETRGAGQYQPTGVEPKRAVGPQSAEATPRQFVPAREELGRQVM